MDMTKYYNDKSFIKLCDLVAKNNLICLTGSGVSKPLHNKNGGQLPNWFELLKSIFEEIQSSGKVRLSAEERMNLTTLINKNASGDELIEASTILRKIDSDTFDFVLKSSVDLKDGEYSDTHSALLDLHPRGIITYNYDVGHENAINAKGIETDWEIILPRAKDRMIQLLRSGLKTPFVLKAHGSIDSDNSMVLTGTSYRELFNRYPHYKAFMQNIFTNYNLLIVGFGLTDPDFDMLLQNLFSVYGSPIHEHIVVKLLKDKTSKDTLFKLRYGIDFLYVDDFLDIPIVLHETTQFAGNELNDLLKKCIDKDIKLRDEAHQKIRMLSDVGKECLASIFERRIMNNIAVETEPDYSNNTENSELVYSYGVIASSSKKKKYKCFLINEVMEKSKFSEPVAHALIHLREIMDYKTDIPLVEKWLSRYENQSVFIPDPENPDPDNRIYKYCDAILSVLKAKAASDNYIAVVNK